MLQFVLIQLTWRNKIKQISGGLNKFKRKYVVEYVQKSLSCLNTIF